MRIDAPYTDTLTATGAISGQSLSLTATGSMANLLLSETATITRAPTSGLGSGIVISATVATNATGTIGSLLFMATGGSFDLANATDTTKAPAQALALESNLGTKRLLLYGTVTNSGWNWSIGPATGGLYLAATGGGMTQVRPAGTDNVIQRVGWAISPTTVMFAPSPDYLTHT